MLFTTCLHYQVLPHHYPLHIVFKNSFLLSGPSFAPAVVETELTRQADSRVRSVYLDPSGTHCIVCLKTSSSTEVQYVHSSWTKPRVLGKLKGLQVGVFGERG